MKPLKKGGRFLTIFLLLTLSSAANLQSSSLPETDMNGKANHLIHEKSPYLLQHAYNPVDWHPWGKEALALAKKLDRPIFLSIGYSTCHWCHVMAHESFENGAIGAMLNKWFICIKVDREERPDIDQMYMAATQALTGSGGWPMSLFLFPDGRPFWAATYIPPVEKYGQPGFPNILEAVHTAWTTRRDELEQAADGLIKELTKMENQTSATISDTVTEQAFSALTGSYDPHFAGFGKAPKFPRPVVFSFLYQYWYQTNNKKALEIPLSTLQAMAAGGMYDQLGGGFHRYSVDGQWRVPHFEKMLYDQSQLADAYLTGFQISGEKQYSAVAADILGYVLRDMRDPAGGFYSAEDADSDDPYQEGKHGEGAWYLWTEEDIVKTLGRDDATIFNYSYGVQFDGNALTDPHKEFTGRNILYLAHSNQEVATKFKKDIAEIEEVLNRSRKKLFNKRQQRTRPHLDDKVLTAWNGLMIGALARGGAILDRPDFTDAAITAANFIREKLYSQKSHQLLRRYRQGEAAISGQLDDYAFLTAGLLDLYQVTQEPQWLQWAMELTSSQIKLFWDEKEGGFFDSLDDPLVVVRMKGDYDGAEPAGNSIAADNLVRLGRITDNPEWLQLAEKTINAFSTQLNRSPHALPHLLTVHQDLQEKPVQVVIAGKPGADDTRKMMDIVLRQYIPGSLLLLADNGKNQQFLGTLQPFIKSVAMMNDQATAYICRDNTCERPITDPALLQQSLQKRSSPDKNP